MIQITWLFPFRYTHAMLINPGVVWEQGLLQVWTQATAAFHDYPSGHSFISHKEFRHCTKSFILHDLWRPWQTIFSSALDKPNRFFTYKTTLKEQSSRPSTCNLHNNMVPFSEYHALYPHNFISPCTRQARTSLLSKNESDSWISVWISYLAAIDVKKTKWTVSVRPFHRTSSQSLISLSWLTDSDTH